MELYEEIMRRNEPKNYTVKWRMADGKVESAHYFTSFDEADLYADDIRARDFVEDVQILRAGRHPSARRYLSSERERPVRQTNSGGFVVNEDAWIIPAGFVDGDADKHGPVVLPSLNDRLVARTNAQKAEWAKHNTFESKTCLWQ